jgi:TRAP-type uncharacterized transport system substrate-binding protein
VFKQVTNRGGWRHEARGCAGPAKFARSGALLLASGLICMLRRKLLQIGLIATAWVATGGHTPYRQWQVYRRRHLLIGTSKADAPTYALGQRIAELLAAHLPESSARVTRGPDPWRLASLLTTGQLEVALLSAADVAALRDGRAPFAAFGPTDLHALFAFGDHLLVCRPDFPAHHAYQVVQTLADNAALIAGARSLDASASPVAIHAGARAYAMGEPMPPPVARAVEEPISPDHVH